MIIPGSTVHVRNEALPRQAEARAGDGVYRVIFQKDVLQF
jgi:hypothetical protein